MNSTVATTENPIGEFSDELKPGTSLLQGQYVIERFLNSGGFGMTYLARDSLDRIVVIKECFPASFCSRNDTIVGARSQAHQKDFKSVVKLFVQEARRMSKLDHPNIVGVHQVFEDNETAYMALDYIEGQDLFDIIEEGRIHLGPVTVRALLLQILNAVDYIHSKNILHRDIAPDNILLDKSGKPILIDFGAAREKATKASRVLSAMHIVKDGYSPQEFYIAESVQSPSSDLYALAATFYHIIVGVAPPNSQTRLACIAAEREDPYKSILTLTTDYDRDFLTAIDKALNIFPDDRIQNARDWVTAIDVDKRREHALALARKDKKIDLSIAKLVTETNLYVFEEIKRAASETTSVKKMKVVKKKPPIVLLSPIFVKENDGTHEIVPPSFQGECYETKTSEDNEFVRNSFSDTDQEVGFDDHYQNEHQRPVRRRKAGSMFFWRAARKRSQIRFWTFKKSRADELRKASL